MIAPSCFDFPTYMDPYRHTTHETWQTTQDTRRLWSHLLTSIVSTYVIHGSIYIDTRLKTFFVVFFSFIHLYLYGVFHSNLFVTTILQIIIMSKNMGQIDLEHQLSRNDDVLYFCGMDSWVNATYWNVFNLSDWNLSRDPYFIFPTLSRATPVWDDTIWIRNFQTE